jgi:hypothetical protein
VNTFPADVKYTFVTGYEMTVGGSGIAIAMIMKPFHLGARAIFTHDPAVISLAFFLRETGRGNDIEPGTGDEISGEDLLGHMV